MNLNVESWKEFKLTDIFIVRGGFYNKKPEHEVEGNIPFLASTETNNGVTEYYSIDDIRKWDKTGNINNTLSQKIYKGNCIAVTVNGSVCNAFYQAEDFTCSHDITALYPIGHTFTKSQALFICTVIMKEKYRWSYGRKPHDVKKFGKSIIKLPVTTSDNVDWGFMERYIKSLNYKPLTTQNSHPQHPLNIDNWQEFRLDDLFSEIYKAEAHVKGDLEFVESPGTNTIKFISRTEMNNGCDCYLPNNGISGIENGNAITIGDTTATCFYQKDEFVCGDHIVVCRAKWLNLYTGLFLVSLLKREKYKYNYGRAFKMDLISNTKVKLPTKSDGTPDFNYMEHYMKSLPYGDRI